MNTKMKIFWFVIREVLMLTCVCFWGYTALTKDMWPAGLFTSAWLFFFIDGTVEGISNIIDSKRRAFREAAYDKWFLATTNRQHCRNNECDGRCYDAVKHGAD